MGKLTLRFLSYLKQEKTSRMASSLECITWMVVGLTESVTIIVLNSLTVIAFYRNRYLRKRSTYLVISLAVADMLSRVISPLDLFYNIGATCNFWRHNAENWYQIPAVVIFWFLGCSLTNMTVISLERLNATFGPSNIVRSKSHSTGFLSSPSGWQHYSFHVRWEWLITIHVNSLSEIAFLRLHNGSIVLFFANSFLNPILYTMRMPGFRRALKMLCRQRPRPQRQVEIIPLREINPQIWI